MAPHFAGDMGENFMLVIQHHAKHCAGQNRLNGPFQFNWLFSAHTVSHTHPLVSGAPVSGAVKVHLRFPLPVTWRWGAICENVDFGGIRRKKLLSAPELFFELAKVHFDEGGAAVRAGVGHGATSQIGYEILKLGAGQRVVGFDGVAANGFGDR